MIHCGLGPEQLRSFFSALNIPPITTKALMTREREIGKGIEQKAADTCESAIEQEISMTREPNSNTETAEESGEEINKFSVSYDGAWQKRGSGRSYNSRSGHGTFIGEKSGKCTAYGVKSTDCRKCLFGTDPSDHDCRKNFAGSAKSMKAAIATDLTSQIMELGYRIKYITMDEDSTTINRIKTCVDPEIHKRSDKNHVKKSLSNSLFEAKKDNKLLSVSIINYLVRNACYAMSQNKDNSAEESGEEINKFSVSYDGAWQKRGSGRSYNSRSGHGTFIGEKSGKCTAYGVKSTDCRKCLIGTDPSDHDCRKNFAGSAKSMKAAIATDLTSQIMELGYRIKYITMDEDSTTINRIKTCVDPEIHKRSDKNHVKKSLSNSLFEAKKDNKLLSVSIINYLVRNACYAMSQNKDNSDNLEKTLKAIVPHAFGEHDHCNESWCGYLHDPDGYKHNDLPGGYDLSDEKLRHDLQQIFNKFAEKSDKLLHCGSFQANESLNQIISTKAPKAKHFGGSESLNFRVAAGVAQKNVGRQYVSDVNGINGLSPGKVTIAKNEVLDKKRSRKKKLQVLPETKKGRKKKRKMESQVQQLCAKTKEGQTYSSDIGMGPSGDNVDISSIPDPIQMHRYVEVEDSTIHPIVTFDLETTGFGNGTEIVQLAAHKEDGDTFERYILPKNPLHPKAAEVTHLYSTGSRLYYRGEPVATHPVHNVIGEFIEWFPSNALLIAHNCKSFDANVIIKHVQLTNQIPQFKGKVGGFADTLPLFKKHYPKRKSYSQSSLAKDLLQGAYEAHNAKEDVLMLKRLVEVLPTPYKTLMSPSFNVDSVIDHITYFEIKKKNLATFNGIIREKVLTKYMCDKAAASGLSFIHLKSACDRNGFDGIRAICSEMNAEGQPRVTKQKAIVERLHKYLTK